MKNQKHYRLLILAVIVALVCSLAACKGFQDETGESAASSDSNASSISKVDVLTSLTNEELQELITGKTTIEEIAEKRAESAAQSEAAASSSASGEDAASSDSAASDSTETPSASSEASSSTSTAQSSSSSTTAAEPAYEAEIRALINQLYGVQAKAQSGLNSAISSAKAEYKALPAEKQTQAKKIAICMGKAGQLKSLESKCDKEVNSIVSQMRKILTENGQPTTLADQAMSTYKSEKSAMYSSLMSQLYG